MTAWAPLAQCSVFLVLLSVLVKPAGAYMARVFGGEWTYLDPVLRPIESLFFRVAKIDPDHDMNWKEVAVAFIAFSLVGTLALYAVLRLQTFLPFFWPAQMTTPMTPDLAANTAVSFATTSTWQAYGGESTMSYFSQMVGLCAQNFMAGAGGLAIGIAFIRGLARKEANGLGNFWVDLVRSVLWILLPISLIGGVFLITQGVPMNFMAYPVAHTLEGASQSIAMGPVAALEVIKNLGTNGGGFFNVNAAHPFENPNGLTNVFHLLMMCALPAALTHTLGLMTGFVRHGWLLFGVMTLLFVSALGVANYAESTPNPLISRLHVSGPNMEGKETRFGIGASTLTAVATSNAATGSTNAMHDSFSPLGGAVPLANMLLGEIVYGGLGTGLVSLVLIALVGVFIAGLMTGRTPDYLGKVLGPLELKYIMLYTLAGPMTILVLTAGAAVLPAGLAGLSTNSGPHGFTEILYCYSSCFANNGQSFAGLNTNSPFYNVTTMIAMMSGRFSLAVPSLALAGAFAVQGRRMQSAGTLAVDTFQFAMVVTFAALIVGALCYFPALALGPVVEHFRLFG